MTLFLSLLPLYIFGNLHCFGMCGPLVMMLGRHRFRGFYFLGRALSYTLAGALAGYLGFVLQALFTYYHISAAISLLFGIWLVLLGINTIWKLPKPSLPFLAKKMASISSSLSWLILKDEPMATFFFGFFTLFLPCGQTLIVFSACALSGVVWVGAFNGLAFALLTSPSLALAMHLVAALRRFQAISNAAVGLSACLVGILATLRGFAEMGWISHMVVFESYPMVFW